MIRVLRRLAWTPPLRALLTRPGVERVVATVLRSGAVRESAGFVARELGRRRVLARYRRRSGLHVYVRHPDADAVALDEVFYTKHYRWPAHVEATLDALGRPPRILDLGANVGLFGVFVLERFPRAVITAFEPDPWNAEVLRLCARANSRAGTWHVLEAAAATGDGTIRFVSGRFALSRVAADDCSSHMVRAVDIFPYLDDADLVKMDIEGAEWAILGDERLATSSLPILVLEYHPHLCPDPKPRDTAVRLVRRAGYACSPIFEADEGHGMLWAWKRR